MSLSDRQKQELRAAETRKLKLAEAARAAMQNEALMAYFDEAERSLIDSLIACEDPEGMNRLRVGALVVRQVRSFLEDGVEAGEVAAKILADLDREERVR